MKIVKGAKRADIYWTARKLIEMLEDGEVDFNIDIQRGYVWKDNDKKSAFIFLTVMFLLCISTR